MKKYFLPLMLIVIVFGCEDPQIIRGTFKPNKVIVNNVSSDIWSGAVHEYVFLVDTNEDGIYDLPVHVYDGQTAIKNLSLDLNIQNIAFKKLVGGRYLITEIN